MNRSHVLILVIVLALAVGAVILFNPGKASAAGRTSGAPATDPALGSGYAGPDAGEEYYGPAPELAPAPSPVKSFLSSSTGKNIALGAVSLPLVTTKLAITGGKAVGKAALGAIRSLF